MPKLNNLPQFFEELKLKEDLTVQGVLNQFKQQIPTNYLEITLEEGNYLCTTKQNWKDKPLSERYGFTHSDEWIQIDITHELLEKLGLERGRDLIGSFYLNPDILTRKPTYGGITLDQEKDIILPQEGVILLRERGTQIDLASSEINRLSNELKEQTELNKTIQTLLEKVFKNNEEKEIAIIFLQEQINQLNQRITELRNNLLCYSKLRINFNLIISFLYLTFPVCFSFTDNKWWLE